MKYLKLFNEASFISGPDNYFDSDNRRANELAERVKIELKRTEDDITYLIDKLIDFEDRGYVVFIDICCYGSGPFTSTDINTEPIVIQKYSTGRNDNLMTYSVPMSNPYPNVTYIESYLKAFKEGKICYQVNLNAELNDKLYTELCNKVSKLEVIQQFVSWSTSIHSRVRTGVVLKANL